MTELAGLASAQALASALTDGELTGVGGVFTDDAALWTSTRRGYSACAGRVQVLRALARLVAGERPARVRVLRSGQSALVLAAFGQHDALWSLELTLDPMRVDGVMVWLPTTSALDLIPER